MKYWLTTHWPPRADGKKEDLGVWLPDGAAAAASGMAPDDELFIYQSGSGKEALEKTSDGQITTIRRGEGRQGIVALAAISGPMIELTDSAPEHYTDGKDRWWRYFASATPLNTAGFIHRTVVAPLLGYDREYIFRGYGRAKSGLAELSQPVFEELKRRFLASTEQMDIDAASTAKPACGRGGLGGEGPEHLALKTAISQRPDVLLNEPGLVLWQMEYALPTGDRIDVVLKDRFGRFVVVEIEVDCDESELVGPMQCMKYRALVSYLHDRDIGEVRSMLVARSLHGSLTKRCSRFGIECRCVRLA